MSENRSPTTTAIERGFAVEMDAALENYPSYRATGAEGADSQGNRYQPFYDEGTHWRGLAVLRVDRRVEIYWKG